MHATCAASHTTCLYCHPCSDTPVLTPPCHSNGIEAVLNARVAAVEQFSVKVVDAQTEQATDIPFGACVWATGVAMNPLVRQLQEKLPEQANFRSLVTDGFLRVKGSSGRIFALGACTTQPGELYYSTGELFQQTVSLCHVFVSWQPCVSCVQQQPLHVLPAGDAATIEQPRALDFADELFAKYDRNGDDRLQLEELQALLQEASERFPHLKEHATFLEGYAVDSGLRVGGLRVEY